MTIIDAKMTNEQFAALINLHIRLAQQGRMPKGKL